MLSSDMLTQPINARSADKINIKTQLRPITLRHLKRNMYTSRDDDIEMTYLQHSAETHE